MKIAYIIIIIIDNPKNYLMFMKKKNNFLDNYLKIYQYNFLKIFKMTRRNIKIKIVLNYFVIHLSYFKIKIK